MNSGHSFKKNKHCEGPEDQNAGDWWIYTAITSDSGLMIAHYGGKRTDATCSQFLDLMFERLHLPLPSARITITTDGNPQYGDALANLYSESCIDYGRLVKRREKNRIVAVFKERVFGNPIMSSISTSVVEGYNNKIRQRISRFGRKTASFSKKIMACIGALNMFQFMNNFMDSKRSTTPAMRESITDHVWTWAEFLTYHIQL